MLELMSPLAISMRIAGTRLVIGQLKAWGERVPWGYDGSFIAVLRIEDGHDGRTADIERSINLKRKEGRSCLVGGSTGEFREDKIARLSLFSALIRGTTITMQLLRDVCLQIPARGSSLLLPS